MGARVRTIAACAFERVQRSPAGLTRVGHWIRDGHNSGCRVSLRVMFTPFLDMQVLHNTVVCGSEVFFCAHVGTTRGDTHRRGELQYKIGVFQLPVLRVTMRRSGREVDTIRNSSPVCYIDRDAQGHQGMDRAHKAETNHAQNSSPVGMDCSN